MTKMKFTLMQASKITGLNSSKINAWIDMEWITPQSSGLLDQEDVARLRLIHELQSNLGVNEEAIPLILHLLDQLCYVQNMLRNGVLK